jgi:uncharacterized YccA/Bax inhibitor family protein
MALMSGSPVLTDERFGSASREIGAGTTSRFTVGGAITATGVLGVLLFISAIAGWMSVQEFEPITNPYTGETTNPVGGIPFWVFGLAIAGFVFLLITMFKPNVAMITGPMYALSYGALVGAISHVYNASYEGIVTQALLATLSIFTVMLLLYTTRIIKVTNRFAMIVAGATAGIAVMYLATWVLSLFNVNVSFLHDGSVLAIGISLFIIIVGALNLAIDFAFIEKAALHEVPKRLEWLAAVGVVVTLVWIYLEVLRLLGMLNRR